jgi:hypothetical protein
MNAELSRRAAERCRELIGRTEIDSVKEQLRIWAAEFDEHAAEEELGLAPRHTGYAASRFGAFSSDG